MKLSQITNFFGVTKQKEPPVHIPPQEVAPALEGPKEVLFQWETFARPKKDPLNEKMARTLLVIGVVVSLILAIMQEFFLIIALVSVVFIRYALSKTPPEHVRHEVSNHGLTYADQFFQWSALKNFFFSNTGDGEVLVVSTKEVLPGRLFLTFNPQDREKLKEIFNKYLLHLEQEPVTFIDKAYKSFLDKFDLEKKQ